MDRLARRTSPDAQPVVVTAFGFSTGEEFVAWQAVSEIWGCKAQSDSEDACLEFSCHGKNIRIDQWQEGFAGLEPVMVAVFPSTAGWRQSLMHPNLEGGRSLLFRRT